MLDCQDDQKPYLLSDNDHKEIYDSYIQPAVMQVSIGRQHPVAYFLGAQPGSGKTKLRQAILQTDDAVVINTDDFRWFHPDYNQLLENPETNEKGSHYVNPDASNWSVRLFNDAIEKRCSIIVDSTLGVMFLILLRESVSYIRLAIEMKFICLRLIHV